MEGDGIGLPDAEDGNVHGVKRVRSTQEGVMPQPSSKQGRSRNRIRHRQPRNAQGNNASTLPSGAATDPESNPNELSGLKTSQRNEDQEVVGDDELDSNDEEGDEDVQVADEGEDKPKELSAKIKKRIAWMAELVQKEAGHVILTLDRSELTTTPFKVTWDEDDIKLLCSYNWQGANDGTNTIFVPGGPAKMCPNKTIPQTIDTDSGYQATDYNYARKPFDPFSPLFTALGVMNPGYQFWDVDVLADRNNLRILLEFIQGKANGPLRLNLHLVYDTLVLVRKGEKFWHRHSNVGIGCNFEKMFTEVEDGMEDATSHYRAIRYPMGPLEVVVRFEADAYYDEAASDELAPTEADAVTGALLAERPRFDFKPPVRFLQKGHIVPTAQMAELKTTTHREDGTPSVQCSDQLWFGRTTHLFTGVYRMEDSKGNILRIKYENTKERVKRWEEKNQDALRKLVDLLTRIRNALKQQDGPVRAGLLVRESRDGPLVLRTMLRKHHIVDREVFATHWDRSRSRGSRNSQTCGRSYQARPQHDMRGSHNQSGAMRSNNNQPYPAGYRANERQSHPSYGGYNAQAQYGRNNYQPHSGYGGNNSQHQPGGYGGNYHQPHSVHPGYNAQQPPGVARGGWNGGRGNGSSRGHYESRGHGRGQGYDSNYGRLSRDF